MSADNVALEFAQLSFDGPASSHFLSQPPPVNIVRPPRGGGAPRRSRNRPCVPSDDEDEDDDDNASASSDEDDDRPQHTIQQRRQISTPHKPRKTQPLPSDDEDSQEEEEEDHRVSEGPTPAVAMQEHISAGHGHHDDNDDETVLGQHVRMLATPEGSHLHHLQQMQLYHQQQLSQFQHSPSGSPGLSLSSPSAHLMRPSQQQQRVSMSGMELLKQLEQEKADAKRQKPKINPSKARIEGLLANLPEPGSHSISFQQMQQQHNQQQNSLQSQYGPKKARPIGRPSSSHGYLDASSGYSHQSRSVSPDRRSYMAYPSYPTVPVDMNYTNAFLQTPMYGYQQPYMMNAGMIPRVHPAPSTSQDLPVHASQRRFAPPLADPHTHS